MVSEKMFHWSSGCLTRTGVSHLPKGSPVTLSFSFVIENFEQRTSSAACMSALFSENWGTSRSHLAQYYRPPRATARHNVTIPKGVLSRKKKSRQRLVRMVTDVIDKGLINFGRRHPIHYTFLHLRTGYSGGPWYFELDSAIREWIYLELVKSLD